MWKVLSSQYPPPTPTAMHSAVATPIPINVLKLGDGFLLTPVDNPGIATTDPARQYPGPPQSRFLCCCCDRKQERRASPGRRHTACVGVEPAAQLPHGAPDRGELVFVLAPTKSPGDERGDFGHLGLAEASGRLRGRSEP